MKTEPELEPLPSLAEIEEGVLQEAQEWARERLQEKLQAQADQIGLRFSPRRTAAGAAARATPDAAHQRRVRERANRLRPGSR